MTTMSMLLLKKGVPMITWKTTIFQFMKTFLFKILILKFTQTQSVLPPKTNDKNCIGTMNFISVLPLPPLLIPSPPTRRAEKGHAGAFQTFSLWRWGDVMPGCMGGKRKSRQEGRMGG